ncbi:MAG: Tritrans,polycis-undecaprenyl-diphosphate synthase (geranylgeranyl-diphosphate specific) [Promethearchaeota archaeon]|jgi:tritrans,polycis-undecaprenyl-diphosphate synthase [geranylgeranyl-diphosphate specific]|nr:MAG: Tritrans,polycis-undecaprenyl-diphosphate synthase (geranylgeranyl-diphosphate specific) [Candidatus Lokiarchaeota archaeon]
MESTELLKKLKDDVGDKLPKHVGIIPDGNRRWARSQGLDIKMGHLNGYKTLKDILYSFFHAGIKYLTVYALSLENARKRSKEELKYIYKIIIKAIETIMSEEIVVKEQVKFRILGRLHLLPEKVRKKVEELHEFTKDFNENFVNILIMYDGQAEIVDAVKTMIKNNVNPDEINRNTLKNYLYTNSFPEVDFIVRTGMEDGARISGFCLWDASYAEFKFRNEYWPQYSAELLVSDLEEFIERNRRRGK